MAEANLHSVDEIKKCFPTNTIQAVITGSEGSIHCAEQLAAYYDYPANTPLITD
ncbi:hypothetical protein [Bartonella rattimassiliensis]|uniref:hypothetical protein n=1 Tax=Bartonella rattimassiliensis TaxID=270250 RepID=UPI000316EF54|nr:hypothetical protein [Bartonella rattimassiliensis]